MIKCKMKYIIILLIFLLIPFVNAESTFFDNPDDNFIMGSSATTGGAVIGGTTGGTTGGAISGGGCLTNWSCSSWSFCIDRIQIRNCTKEKADCYADLKTKPAENQSCSIETEKEGDLISQSPPMNFKNIILIVIGLIVIMGIAVFFALQRHRKRRYYHYGY